MKDFSTIHNDHQQQQQQQEKTELINQLEKKSILFKLKSVLDLPDIFKKSNQYKLVVVEEEQGKAKSPTIINLKDGNIILSTNQNRNEHEKLTFVETRTEIQFHTNFLHQLINITKDQGLTQNLMDTGFIGGFEYWDGKSVDLPNLKF